MRKCLFCDQRADSAEDAWPRWITGQFVGSGQPLMEAERRGEKLPSWRLKRPELRIKWVCRECNNGWMSRLEENVIPYLQPLVAGQQSLLTDLCQTAIALWTMKTAMVLEGLDTTGTHCFSQTERERLRTLQSIPWRTTIWIAPSADPSLFVSSKVRHLDPADRKTVTGFSTTIGLAHIVLQALTIRVPDHVGPKTKITVAVRQSPWNDVTKQIWPPRPAAIRWPPTMALNGIGGIDAFAARFDTRGLPESETAELIV